MRARWDWTIVGGWVLALVVVRAARLTERDPYWQARDGLERWSGIPLSRPDSWSYAGPEGTFRPTSPAWNSALGLGFDRLGFGGISVVGAVGMLAYFAIAIVIARRLGARPLPTLVATGVVSFLAFPMISARAPIVIEALLLGTLGLGLVIVSGPVPGTRWANLVAALGGAILGWVGTWLHVSWSVSALGLACALPTLALLAGTSRRRFGLALAAGVGLLIGSCLGPYRLSVWQLLFDISAASDGQIVEWLSPFTPGLRARWLPVVGICLVLMVMCGHHLARHRPRIPGSRERCLWALEVLILAISVAAMAAGAFAIRFLAVAALSFLPVAAHQLSLALVRWRSRPDRKEWLRVRLGAAYWRPILTGVLVVLAPLAVRQSIDPGRPMPEAQLAKELPNGCQLFAPPSSTGAVLLVRPDITVWIDMRTEVYGVAAYDDVRRRLFAPDGVRIPAGTTCALLPTSTERVHPAGDGSTWKQHAMAGGLTVWLPD